MSEVVLGWKLCVLLVQVLFFDLDILLLDEFINNLDIDIICWLEDVINECKSIMVIIFYDCYFLNVVCIYMVDIDYGELMVYFGNYDDFMMALI